MEKEKDPGDPVLYVLWILGRKLDMIQDFKGCATLMTHDDKKAHINKAWKGNEDKR